MSEDDGLKFPREFQLLLSLYFQVSVGYKVGGTHLECSG